MNWPKAAADIAESIALIFIILIIAQCDSGRIW